MRVTIEFSKRHEEAIKKYKEEKELGTFREALRRVFDEWMEQKEARTPRPSTRPGEWMIMEKEQRKERK
jgi:hypothetical protein